MVEEITRKKTNINRPDYVSCNAFERRLAVFLSSRNTSKVFSRTVHLSPFLPLLQKRVHASARCNTVEHPRWLTVHVGSCVITVKRFYTFTISVKFSSFHNSIVRGRATSVVECSNLITL